MVRNQPGRHFDTGCASAANRNVSRLHGRGWGGGGFYHGSRVALTWYPELGATLWGYKEAQQLGDLVTGDRRGVFTEAGEVLPKENLLV